MFGPDGTVGSGGAGPRPVGTSSHTIVMLSFSQSHGSPVVALMRSLPVTAFAAPVAVSAIHRSMPFSFVLRNERCAPSGENLMLDRLACGGTVTFVSPPSAIRFIVIA